MMMRPASKEFHIQMIGVDGKAEPCGEITSVSEIPRNFQQSNFMIVERAQSARLLRRSIARPSHRGDGRACTVSKKSACAGIVLFERDNLLLRRRPPPRDFTLLDLDQAFVKMLSLLRKENVAFGFLSDQRGMDASSYGKRAYLRLIEVLATILEVQGAMPDFWITPDNDLRRARAEESPSCPALGYRELRALFEFLRVNDRDAAAPLYVCGSVAAGDAANQAGFASIRYARWQRTQTASTTLLRGESNIASYKEAVDVAQLHMLIKEKLTLADQAPARH